MISTTSTLFEAELRKLIDGRVAVLIENLVGGLAITDYTVYREKVGEIRGLRTITNLCEEVNIER